MKKDFKMSVEQKELFDKLTPLQQKMSINTIKGMSPSESHKKAGGVCKTEKNRKDLGSQILANPLVKAYLDSMMVEAVSSAVMSREEMMERLTGYSRTNMSDLVTFGRRTIQVLNKEGEFEEIEQAYWAFKDNEDMTEMQLASIDELSCDKGVMKIKKVSSLSAMKQLADLQGYNKAKEVNLNVNKADASEW